jgi:hypothetical protein
MWLQGAPEGSFPKLQTNSRSKRSKAVSGRLAAILSHRGIKGSHFLLPKETSQKSRTGGKRGTVCRSDGMIHPVRVPRACAALAARYASVRAAPDSGKLTRDARGGGGGGGGVFLGGAILWHFSPLKHRPPPPPPKQGPVCCLAVCWKNRPCRIVM